MANDLTSFGLQSNFVNLNGHKMHYIDEGAGVPLVFLHGVPTWSYLWRHVIPNLTDQYRCIAPDMMGFGLSDKPDIEYNVFEHIDYFNQFLQSLGLEEYILVMHGWGSVVGFHTAMNQPDRVKGLVFLESHVRANTDWSMLSLPIQELAEEMSSSDDQGLSLIMDSDYYLTQVFKPGILSNLSDEEWINYIMPFQQAGSNKPIWQYLQDLPLKSPNNQQVVDLIDDYSVKLQQSPIPKLMMYAVPGFITTMDTVSWAKDNIGDLSLVDIGDALHYPQESNPELISDELKNWLSQQLSPSEAVS